MNALRDLLLRALRGPGASRLLERCGIDPRRFWLLMDLFDHLSDRGEMMDQLGRAGVALKTTAWLYTVMAALMSAMMLLRGVEPALYLYSFLLLTGFILTAILMSETGNSLVNPVEGLVLAHQPIDGATYTAAKLSHLLRIVGFLVLGLDGLPALCGLFLPHARWYFPLLHFAAAFAVGLAAALLCCALFGWLMRFIPAKRLKAAGQIAGTLPFLGMFAMGQLDQMFRKIGTHWLPQSPGARWAVGASLVAAALVAVLLGIRSLSADYLVRVSQMMHGGSKTAVRRSRPSPAGDLVAHFCGGAPARAGFAYTRSLMLRDFQFRRQILPMALMLPFSVIPLLSRNWNLDPFGAKFSGMHLLPHIIGIVLCLVCNLLPYSSEYKGGWVFLLAPDRALPRFANGIWALLWLGFIAIPHVVLAPFFAAAWGLPHATLFIAYSLAAASVYLALDLRLVESIPFTTQLDPARGAAMMPIMILGVICVTLAVVAQHFVLFRSPLGVIAAIPILTAVAYTLTRLSLGSLAVGMRYNLGIATTESTAFYKEVGA